MLLGNQIPEERYLVFPNKPCVEYACALFQSRYYDINCITEIICALQFKPSLW